jgi:hypothetical protein
MAVIFLTRMVKRVGLTNPDFDLAGGCLDSESLSMKTVSEHLNLIRAVCRHHDLPDPTRGVERPRKKQSERIESMEFCSSEELKAIREAAGPDLTNALEFLAFSGCRVGEMGASGHRTWRRADKSCTSPARARRRGR